MGSKNRHAKYILPLILKDRKKDQWYVEPFVGGFNIIDKVDGKRIGSDSHFYLIELFISIQKGWEPPDFVDEDMYQKIKLNPEKFPGYLVGFVGFGCSFASKWFGGYARDRNSKGNPRNYCGENKRNILKQASELVGIKIYNENYLDLKIPPNSIIYCDPPYFGTTSYRDSFDHIEFWKWCQDKVETGHKVFVSEYTAPDNWRVIWSKIVNNTLVKETGSKQGTEKLFTLEQE